MAADHRIEMLGERQCRLAIAGGAVPDRVMSRALCKEPGGELRRVGRSRAGVGTRLRREMVGVAMAAHVCTGDALGRPSQ